MCMLFMFRVISFPHQGLVLVLDPPWGITILTPRSGIHGDLVNSPIWASSASASSPMGISPATAPPPITTSVAGGDWRASCASLPGGLSLTDGPAERSTVSLDVTFFIAEGTFFLVFFGLSLGSFSFKGLNIHQFGAGEARSAIMPCFAARHAFSGL